MRFIKTFLALIIALTISNAIIAQAILSPVLSNKLKANNVGFIKVNLVLTQQANLDSLRQVFKQNNTPSQIRAKTTLNYLQNTAEKSQKSILNYLYKKSNLVSDIQTYWIVNIITLKAKPIIIYELAQHKSISVIQTDEHKYFCYEPVAVKADNKKNITEAESGLYAINAPAMWNLGYTGRNRIALGVDTGVKHRHPAIANRFLGNYRPLNQAWFGYNNPTPEDVAFASFHGTHTIGTVLGLDRTANDTIGVAFNAYWMASDPIVTSLSDVRPLDVVLKSFEWALNPDGNINTVNDMPDVITNSWGWDGFYDFNDCDIPEAQAIFAAETAGIGVIFSAGNEGPNATTIGQPANLAPGLLSVFSVGAVNGHTSELLIAEFSSRGPTTCVEQEDDYSRWVKPEVVAPGVNVRSAQDEDSYGQLSGTSMASPHVAGAFLLLKEAFPFLPGEDILGALYNSAIDLGDQGEDNTYGKGMIDVKKAFDLLSQSHTPVEPANNSYDIAIKEVKNLPFGYTFNQLVSPLVVVKNLGEQYVNDINICVTVNSNIQNFSFTDAIPQGEERTFSLSDVPIQEGTNCIKIAIDLTIDIVESDMINNLTYVDIKVPKKVGLPFAEHFDTTAFSFTNTYFTLVNHNSDYTWVIDTAGGLPQSINSVRLDFTKMKKRNDQYDDLLSPLLTIPVTEDSISLQFKYAYARRIANVFKDSLMVLISTDLGNSWLDTVFAEGGEGLATIDKDMSNNRYIPELEDEWRNLHFNLNRYKGEDILINFRTVNDNGSNLYLDDIMVFKGQNPNAIEYPHKKSNIEISVFPNPVDESLMIVFNQPIQNGTISILNSLGQKVYFSNIVHNSYTSEINVAQLDKGLYFAQFSQENCIIVKKIIKK